VVINRTLMRVLMNHPFILGCSRIHATLGASQDLWWLMTMGRSKLAVTFASGAHESRVSLQAAAGHGDDDAFSAAHRLSRTSNEKTTCPYILVLLQQSERGGVVVELKPAPVRRARPSLTGQSVIWSRRRRTRCWRCGSGDAVSTSPPW
jgi:hypothetical protein